MNRTCYRLPLLVLALAFALARPAAAGHRPELDASATGHSRARATALVTHDQL